MERRRRESSAELREEERLMAEKHRLELGEGEMLSRIGGGDDRVEVGS